MKVKCPLCEKEVFAQLVEECEGGYKMLRCHFCHLEFAHPLKGPGKEGYESLFKNGSFGDVEAIRYASRLRSMQPYLEEYHKEAIKYLKRLNIVGLKLLDVGCADGGFIKTMKKLGFDVYGCDIAEEPVKFAQQVHHLKKVVASTIEGLPKDWREFDIITCFEVLEHVDNPSSFLKSIYNLLKPGGLLLLSVPHYETLSIMRRRGFRADSPPLHLTRWPRRTLGLILKRSGFHISKNFWEKPVSSLSFWAFYNYLLLGAYRDKMCRIVRFVVKSLSHLFYLFSRPLLQKYYGWSRLVIVRNPPL